MKRTSASATPVAAFEKEYEEEEEEDDKKDNNSLLVVVLLVAVRKWETRAFPNIFSQLAFSSSRLLFLVSP